MTDTNRQQSLARISQLLAKPGGAQAIRFMLSSLGSLPLVGGAIAGSAATWAEREQSSVNRELYNWASLADSQLNQLIQLIEQMHAEPTPASLAILVDEILGEAPEENKQIPVVLNPSTVEELQPYIQRRWISLQSTGAVCSMGSGNRVGNHVEELKRPYGIGSGFILTVRTWGLEVQ
jgi:hypothetical protein